jgi:hypothetical protein
MAITKLREKTRSIRVPISEVVVAGPFADAAGADSGDAD